MRTKSEKEGEVRTASCHFIKSDRLSQPGDPAQGFTLVELCVALALTSVLGLALIDVSTLSSRATQSNNATDEFNTDASLLLTVLSSPAGCTSAFAGMAVGANGPVISPTVPPPSPLSAFLTYIATATPVAITTNYLNPALSSIIIQVTAPSALTANASFPVPQNNLWITNIGFTSLVDTAVSVSGTFTQNLYNLNLSAQKVSTGPYSLLGGLTTYNVNFLVALWVNGAGTVDGCGTSP